LRSTETIQAACQQTAINTFIIIKPIWQYAVLTMEEAVYLNKSTQFPRHIWTFTLLYGAASFLHFWHNAQYITFYPNMPAWLTNGQVYMAWAAINSIGIAGVILYFFQYRLACLALLGIYGAFGFGALGHYALALCSQHTLAMNLTIWFEILTGALLSSACLYAMISSKTASAVK
jgi:hypothetical protein